MNKKSTLRLLGMVAAINSNIELAIAQEVGVSASNRTFKAGKLDDVNVKLSTILPGVLTSRDEMDSFKADPETYLTKKGLSPLQVYQIFTLDHSSSGVAARTGVSTCRPYSYTPVTDGLVAPEFKDIKVGGQMSEQNIRLLEWFNRNQ